MILPHAFASSTTRLSPCGAGFPALAIVTVPSRSKRPRPPMPRHPTPAGATTEARRRSSSRSPPERLAARPPAKAWLNKNPPPKHQIAVKAELAFTTARQNAKRTPPAKQTRNSNEPTLSTGLAALSRSAAAWSGSQVGTNDPAVSIKSKSTFMAKATSSQRITDASAPLLVKRHSGTVSGRPAAATIGTQLPSLDHPAPVQWWQTLVDLDHDPRRSVRSDRLRRHGEITRHRQRLKPIAQVAHRQALRSAPSDSGPPTAPGRQTES